MQSDGRKQQLSGHRLKTENEFSPIGENARCPRATGRWIRRKRVRHTRSAARTRLQLITEQLCFIAVAHYLSSVREPAVGRLVETQPLQCGVSIAMSPACGTTSRSRQDLSLHFAIQVREAESAASVAVVKFS
jgi:hypothetical protein